MTYIIIRHEWNTENQEAAFKTVNQILETAKQGKLPSGFRLLSSFVDTSTRTAFCTYEAPSKRDFQSLVAQINPPTKYTIHEVSKLY
jgi:hypothetical protein